MEKLPTELAEEDDQNETRLLRMFRPQDGTRRLFKIFLASLDKRSIFSRLVCGLTEAIRQYRWAVLLALVATAVLVLSGPLVLTWLGWSTPPPYGFDLRVVGLGSWVLALLIALVFAVALTLILGIVWDFRCELVGTVSACAEAGRRRTSGLRRTSADSCMRPSSWPRVEILSMISR